MKFLIFFGSAIILAHYSEQQIVMLNSGGKHREEKSHEIIQLDPVFRDAVDEVSAQMGEDPSADPNGPIQSESEDSNGKNSDQSEDSQSQSASQASDEELSESSESSKSKKDAKHPGDEGMLLVLQYANNGQGLKNFGGEDKISYWNKWVREIAAGNKGDIVGTNPHKYQPNEYPDFGRRFVPVYPYTEEPQNVIAAPDNKEIIPIQAPLEVVTLVAKESAMKEAAKAAQDDTQDLMRNKILRTGDFWNAVWVEKVEPKAALRSPENNEILSTIKAKVKPGSEFYDVVANMTKISPKLLYIINDKKAS